MNSEDGRPSFSDHEFAVTTEALRAIMSYGKGRADIHKHAFFFMAMQSRRYDPQNPTISTCRMARAGDDDGSSGSK